MRAWICITTDIVACMCLSAGVRDYVHVVDLALGHVASLQLFEREEPVGCVVRHC